MPINYQIAADVVDIQTDTPKKDDKFFIDTNVWFWMTYTQASNSARHYQITNYPSYVNSILDAGGSVAEKPSESGNNTHFQRHSCPGPDLWPEKGKKGIFSRNPLLETAFLPFSAIFNTFHPLSKIF